jgi:hypothetical protein
MDIEDWAPVITQASKQVCFTKRVFCSVGCSSAVGIATRYGLDGAGIESWKRGFSASIQTCLGAHPPSYKMVTG